MQSIEKNIKKKRTTIAELNYIEQNKTREKIKVQFLFELRIQQLEVV